MGRQTRAVCRLPRLPHTSTRAATLGLCLWPLLCSCTGAGADGLAASEPLQVPLCMVGDSITWAQEGDFWRAYLLENLPRLAFVGTHSAVLGYSHAGEGGDSTVRVLRRLAQIPDCPYYSLLIGTNDNNIKDETAIQSHAAGTAERIEAIVKGLLQKPGVKTVFLGSVLPCDTDNPLRDRTNAATNAVLRETMNSAFPAGKVVWVEYEEPIRAMENWEPMIRLHPTKDGYRVLAKILSDRIVETLSIQDPTTKPAPADGVGVPIDNLWSADEGQTRVPVIPGWYTVSCDVMSVEADAATVTIRSADQTLSQPLSKAFPVTQTDAGKRVVFRLFTGYQGYGYSSGALEISAAGCRITRILFEKKRPGDQGSAYGEASYIDTQTVPLPGELWAVP